MNNFQTYNQRLKIINGMKSESRKEASEKKRLKNQLIREIAPKFRQTNQQEYLQMLLQIFKRAMNSTVFSKIPAQDRKNVLAKIQSEISKLAMKGTKKSTYFPLEEEGVDQSAYINGIIKNVIYDYYKYLRKYPREPKLKPDEEPIEVKKTTEKSEYPPSLKELVNAGKLPEGNIPVDKLIGTNTLGDDQGEGDESDSSSFPRAEIQMDPLFDVAFAGRNIPDPETAAIKNQIDKITKKKMSEEIGKIEDNTLREILSLRIKDAIPFREIGSQVFPYLSVEKAEELARNKYEYHSKNIVKSLRKDPDIKKLFNLK